MIMAVLIFLAGVIVRLPGLFRPLLGNFATKSAGYAMIARNFCLDPSTFFNPTLNIIINGQKSFHMTEWPFFSYLAGAVYKIMPFIGLDATGRALNVFLFSFSGLFVYYFVKSLWSAERGLAAFFIYLFFPLGIVYGQSFQLEPAIALCISVTFFLIDAWIEGKRSPARALFVWLAISVLLLMKIQMICLAVPAFALVVSDVRGRELFRRPSFYVFAISCLILPVAWYEYTFIAAREYDNVFFSVLYSMMIRSFPDPRIFTLDFYLRIAYILLRSVFSPVGILLVAAGMVPLFKRLDRRTWFTLSYFSAVLIYFILMPRKIYEMDYYYIPLLLPGAVAAAEGLYLFSKKWVRGFLLAVFCVSSIFLAWNPAFKTTGNELILEHAGKYVDSMLAEEDRVIVCSEGSAVAFLYYTKRDGYELPVNEIVFSDLEQKARRELSLRSETSPIKLFDLYMDEGAAYFACDNEDWLKTANPELYEHICDGRKIFRDASGVMIVELKKVRDDTAY